MKGAAVNGECDEKRKGRRDKMCSVNEVTNWVETCSSPAIPLPRSRQKSNYFKIP